MKRMARRGRGARRVRASAASDVDRGQLSGFLTRKRSAAKAVGRTPQQIGEEFTDLLREDREVQLPPYLWGLARVLGLLFGVSNSLGVKLDLVGSLLPHLARREQR